MKDFLIALNPFVPHGIAALAAFMSTLARGFQNKNVANGFKKLAFMFGAMMAIMDGFVIYWVAKGGLSVLPASALGAGTGWVCGMLLHDLLTAEYRAAAKEKKRKKREAQIHKIVEKSTVGLRDHIHKSESN